MLAQLVPLACALTLFVATRAAGSSACRCSTPWCSSIACSASFENPARAALLPTLVPREVFPRAVTLASTGQALAFMSGPAGGGVIIAEFGVGSVYGCYGLLHASGRCSAWRCCGPRRRAGCGAAISWSTVREGLRFVRRNPVVLGCMTLDMFAVIFGGATALLPIYANDILQVGAAAATAC